MRLTVENISKTPIDFIRPTFTDSTSDFAQDLLAEGSLSAFDTYELSRDLRQRPVFSYDTSNTLTHLGPCESGNLTISCIGKAGW
jgi:hypothetical protein